MTGLPKSLFRQLVEFAVTLTFSAEKFLFFAVLLVVSPMFN